VFGVEQFAQIAQGIGCFCQEIERALVPSTLYKGDCKPFFSPFLNRLGIKRLLAVGRPDLSTWARKKNQDAWAMATTRQRWLD
jgi:hypothetical protein